VYLTTVTLAALSTVLLVAPVAYHRLLFRRHQKESVVRITNVMAIAGWPRWGSRCPARWCWWSRSSPRRPPPS